jgi:hypothetical protein
LRSGHTPRDRALSKGTAGTALVVIPETVNFFNDIAGRRLADALRHRGRDVQVITLRDYSGESADVAFLVSIVELFVSCGTTEAARKNLDALRGRCDKVVLWLLEPTRTRWFDSSYQLMRECELEVLADNALHDQSGELDEEQKRTYHHLFYGLTEREKRLIRDADFEDERRSIPWAFVGHKTRERCELARRLIEEVDPAGFFYLSDILPITDHGPHLKDAEFQRVLRRSRYQIWRSHHSAFYMEGERFRRSALAGCVPLKVVFEDQPGRRRLPFPYLVVRQEELAESIDPVNFAWLRSKFLEEYCGLPSLEVELGRFFESLGRAKNAA